MSSNHAKLYSTYKNLGPKKEQSDVPPVMEVQDLLHRKKIISDNNVVCIDLYATWCGPCKGVAPKFALLAQKYSGKCVLVKENVDLALTRDVKVSGIPAFIFYKGNQLVVDQEGEPLMVVGGNVGKVEEIIQNLCKS